MATSLSHCAEADYEDQRPSDGDLPAGRASAAVSPQKYVKISKAGERGGPICASTGGCRLALRDVLATGRRICRANFRVTTSWSTRRLAALRLLSGRLLRGARMLYGRHRWSLYRAMLVTFASRWVRCVNTGPGQSGRRRRRLLVAGQHGQSFRRAGASRLEFHHRLSSPRGKCRRRQGTAEQCIHRHRPACARRRPRLPAGLYV